MKLFDSSTLIAILGEISEPQILHNLVSLGYKLYAPARVVLEVSDNPEKTHLVNLIHINKIEQLPLVDDVEISIFRNRYPRLGVGEVELIIIAKKWSALNKKFCCIIDDAIARRTAEEYGLKCKGTIGILQKLNEKGLIETSTLKLYYKKLKENGFRYNFNGLA